MKHLVKLLLLLLLLPQFHSVTKAEEYTNTETESPPLVYQDVSAGLIGYHFNDTNFNDLALITNHPTGDLEVSFEEMGELVMNQQRYQSACWMGKIKISESGLYTFKTSANKYIRLWINNQQLINEDENVTPIELESGNSYDIKIEYQNKDAEPNNEHLYLHWIKPNNQEEIVPTNNFLFPDNIVSQEEDLKNSKRNKRNVTIPTLPDSDDDGIPDSLETNGYTVDVRNGKLVVVGWNENVHRRKGLTKYYSSPMKWSTASDPYSDFQKVTGLIDKQIKPEARNPLVVAYPIVNTDMEQIIVSKNNNISIGNSQNTSQTVTKSMNNSKTDSISASVNAELSASLSDITAKVATSFSKEHSTTTSVEEGTSDTSDTGWSNSIGIQTGESAYFGANVRYKNRGTAPIYKVKPTTTFVLGNDQSIATITAKENQIANVLPPDGFYPSKTQAPIMINTKDDFSASPITLNFEQLRTLEEQKKMRIEMNQVSGGVGVLQRNGEIQVTSDWGLYLPQIENTSAHIIFDTKDNEAIERRITAIDPDDVLEKTKPEITLKEALKLAFNIREENKQFYYKDRIVGGFEIICDPETLHLIQEQLNQMNEKNIYNVKLNAKMNFLIKELSVSEAIDQLFVKYKRGQGLKPNITQEVVQHVQEIVNTLPNSSQRSQLQTRIDDANLIIKLRSLANVNVTKINSTDYRLEFRPNIRIPEIMAYGFLISNGGESWEGDTENIVNIDRLITISNADPESYVNFVITLQSGKSYVLYEQ
ncbi:hypothetical protein IIU_06717 [Bacillus cereus VD133]|uniref:PA14 domain-containing protein n=1 Tax=Bacillus cereus VD133 TaxID=1053233 RepID=A0A9W5UZ21_BACCE|nr:binary toxin-like calcium binding domain-containing protein [Bacillus cereus]EOO24495.1 hypothetical protein IIU_06717 [Bacillus cereus VD133]